MSESPTAKTERLLEFVTGWGRAFMAATVSCVLAPFWIVGAILGAFWWAVHSGFMEGKK